MSLFPLARFDSIVSIEQANVALREWGHKMGPFTRPESYGCRAHGLFVGEDLVGLAITAALVRERVGGGLGHLGRHNALELARLCAVRSGLNRVVLRLWRELVFPALGVPIVISYADTDIHNGNTYRFDGWEKVGFCRAGGDDPRSGRKARNRNVWAWPPGSNARLRSEAESVV